MEEKEELNLELLKETFTDLLNSTPPTEGGVDFAEATNAELMKYRDITMIRYGVYKSQYKKAIAIENEKKRQKNMKYYENAMEIANEQYKKVNELLQQINLYLRQMDSAMPNMVVTNDIEEGINSIFTPYSYELLVNMEEIKFLANTTQRVELRIPLGLLDEIDNYQLANSISSRSQAIFELCRMSLNK